MKTLRTCLSNLDTSIPLADSMVVYQNPMTQRNIKLYFQYIPSKINRNILNYLNPHAIKRYNNIQGLETAYQNVKFLLTYCQIYDNLTWEIISDLYRLKFRYRLTADEKNAIVNISNKKLLPTMISSIEHNRVASFINQNINATICNGNTPLNDALIDKNNILADFLIDRGANTNIKATNGQYPIHMAVINQHIYLVDKIISLGNINVSNEQGMTAVDLAVKYKHIPIIKLLLSHKGIITKKTLKSIVRNSKTWVFDIMLKYFHLNFNYIFQQSIKYNNLYIIYELIKAGYSISSNINGRSTLELAIKYNKTEIFMFFISVGANIHVKTNVGLTYLMLAAQKDNAEIIELLIRLGMNPNEIHNNSTALIEAIKYKNLQAVMALCRSGANTNTCVNSLCFPLQFALNSTREIQQYLLDNDAIIPYYLIAHEITQAQNFDTILKLFHQYKSINSSEIKLHFLKILFEWLLKNQNLIKNGYSYLNPERTSMFYDTNDHSGMILLSAASAGHEDIVEFLMIKNIPCDYCRTDNTTPLILASSNGNINIVNMLLNNGANVNHKNNSAETALMISCKRGHDKVVQKLVDYGASINYKDKSGATALINAVENQNEKIVDILLKQNDIRIDLSNNANKSPLIYAVMKGNFNLVKKLYESGADVNHKTIDGHTPLTIAAFNQRKKILKFLVDHMADVNHQNSCGENALMFAIINKDVKMVKYLVEHGAKVNVANECNYTPLMMAAEYNCVDITKMLMQNGASNKIKNINDETALKIAQRKNHQEICSLIGTQSMFSLI